MSDDEAGNSEDRPLTVAVFYEHLEELRRKQYALAMAAKQLLGDPSAGRTRVSLDVEGKSVIVECSGNLEEALWETIRREIRCHVAGLLAQFLGDVRKLETMGETLFPAEIAKATPEVQGARDYARP